MYELFDQIIQSISEGTEPVFSLELNREDYLLPGSVGKNHSSLAPREIQELEKENCPPASTPGPIRNMHVAQLIPNSVLAAGDIIPVSSFTHDLKLGVFQFYFKLCSVSASSP